MDDKKITKNTIEQKTTQNNTSSKFGSKLQTNPILERMLYCTELSKKMKFKIKDLFK